MMLGVYDYYKVKNFTAYQIIPDNDHYALDIPDMASSWDSNNIIWKWLDDNIKWDLDIPSRKTSKLTLADWIKNNKIPVPHYHRGKGSNLKYHRPWEKGPDGKRRW